MMVRKQPGVQPLCVLVVEDDADTAQAWVWLLRNLRSQHEGTSSAHLYGWEDERDRHLAIIRQELGLHQPRKSAAGSR